VARSKTAVDAAGRAYLKKLKEMPKGIEAELREFITAMDALRDEVRQPLNEYEAAEVARRDAIEDAIQVIVDHYEMIGELSSEALRMRIAALETAFPPDEVYGDRLEEAQIKRKHGIAVLGEALAKRTKFEDEQAELERLRKEAAARAEQDRIDAAARQAVEAERQRVANEQQAQREADAQRVQQAEQQTREAEQRAQQAEQERIASEQRAEQERQQAAQRQQQAAEQARLAEQQRQQAELAEQQRQTQAREADKAHRGAINKAALDALLAVNMSAEGQPESFLSQTEAKAIISAIIRGQIPAVSIAY
jgi:hypothetical protein